jgi:hypothetical protein
LQIADLDQGEMATVADLGLRAATEAIAKPREPEPMPPDVFERLVTELKSISVVLRGCTERLRAWREECSGFAMSDAQAGHCRDLLVAHRNMTEEHRRLATEAINDFELRVGLPDRPASPGHQPDEAQKGVPPITPTPIASSHSPKGDQRHSSEQKNA